MKFGDILRKLLEEKGITRKELASKLDISLSTVGNYICNTREPDFETLKRLADYFSVSIDYLLNYQSNNTTDHMEDDVLRIFRLLDDNQKELYLEQGKVFLKLNQKEK